MIRQYSVFNVRTLTKSFVNAYKGIAFCIRNERNMRIHLTFTFYVLVFAPFYHFSTAEMLILLLAIGMVLFAEAVNTAIEALVNLEIQCYDHLAKIAKDVAAGAVLICAIFAACIGLVLYLKPQIIVNIIAYFLANWVLGALLIISLPLFILFILGLPFRNTFLLKK